MKGHFAVMSTVFVLLMVGPLRLAGEQPAIVKAETAIEDNSFMIEEAFNQEKNVIQHINTFTRDWNGGGWVYTFTQEWPFPGHERHQLSVAMSAVDSGDYPGVGAGLGDRPSTIDTN